jgi:hypothetical protein
MDACGWMDGCMIREATPFWNPPYETKQAKLIPPRTPQGGSEKSKQAKIKYRMNPSNSKQVYK